MTESDLEDPHNPCQAVTPPLKRSHQPEAFALLPLNRLLFITYDV
jgi:hypothetical protein